MSAYGGSDGAEEWQVDERQLLLYQMQMARLDQSSVAARGLRATVSTDFYEQFTLL